MMFAPGPGALAQVWLIGAYAAAVGVFRMMLSFGCARFSLRKRF